MNDNMVLFEPLWDSRIRALMSFGVWDFASGLKNSKIVRTGKLEGLYKAVGEYLSLVGSFVSVLIFRGMGFRSNLILNQNPRNEVEFVSTNAYLHIKVGYSFNLFIALPSGVRFVHSKRDRKLVIIGLNKQISTWAQKLISLVKEPSVYTGRGVRIKGKYYVKKLGKKDARGGSGRKVW